MVNKNSQRLDIPVASKSQLSFLQDGAPFCDRFDDIYFDSESGYQQSHEIFIESNDIIQRLLNTTGTLTIAETGFGTGLNFLLTLQAYQEAQKQTSEQLPRLHFISVEKYPLSKVELTKSLAILPQLSDLTSQLIAVYPAGNPDSFGELHQCEFFNQKIKLTLLFDDASNGLAKLSPPRTKPLSHTIVKTELVDVWYLDGFSPAKNPAMWSDALFSQIARLSQEQATLSTFTVAGFVKRHLQAIGFRIRKRSSQGKKKEVLCATFQQNPNAGKGYQIRPNITKPQHVSLIGGGIASACAAYALTKQGIKVTLYCKDDVVAQGGSSNAIGALYPLLHQNQDDISLFYQQAFWRAKSLYQEVFQQGFEFSHQWCGLLEVSYKEALQKRQQSFAALKTWPDDLIHSVDSQTASDISGVDLSFGGLFMPNAGWASPKELVQQVFKAAQSTGRLKIKTNTLVSKVIQQPAAQPDQNSTWLLSTNKGEVKASVLVICGGAEMIDFEYIQQLPLTPTRGQVTSMQTNSNIAKLSTVICHKGYLTPQNNGVHCIGATFQKNQTNTQATDEDDRYNLAMLKACLPELSDHIHWQQKDIAHSKARLRCMSQDHLPLVGPMPNISEHIISYPHLAKDKNWRYHQPAPVIDNLYVFLGLGARGLCSAPLAADILAADLCNTPYPVNNTTLFNLSPNRFVIRDIIKRKI